MHLRSLHVLSGPNVWSRSPVVEARIDLAGTAEVRGDGPPWPADRVLQWLPSLLERPGDFVERLRRGLPAAEAIARIAAELQALVVGIEREPALVAATAEPGTAGVVIRCDDEPVARACLQVACDLLASAVGNRTFDIADALTHLRNTANLICIGPTTGTIVAAARRRGIPTRRLDDGSLVLLGHGCKQHRIRMAVTDHTAAIPQDIAQDKELTKRLLADVGVPVPAGRAVTSAADAWQAACEIGLPIVVKPRNANHGRGVSINLTSREQVERAYAVAVPEGDGVLVEEFAVGTEHRLLIIDDRMVAASRGEPESVVGDGVQTITQLVAELNADPRRGEDWASPLCTVLLDDMALMTLDKQGYTVDSIPADGVTVLVHHNGEFLTDVTDEVHPATAAACVLAARVVGLNIAGIDVIAGDIRRPSDGRNVRIIEVNSGPGLRMHFDPQFGKPRPVGDIIVAGMFAPGDDGRIPIVAVCGDRRATNVARRVRDLIVKQRPHAGLASDDGLHVGSQTLKRGRCDDAANQRAVLLHPDVDAAVFAMSAAAVRRDGLGFDQCVVTVLLNDETDAEVRRVLIEATDAERGIVVLEPGDTAGVELAKRLGRKFVLAAAADDESVAAAVADHVD